MLKNRRADLIVVAAILVIGLSLLIFTKLTEQTGKTVEISVDREVIKVLPLTRDAEYTIETEDGGLNRVVIKNGTAYMASANCPDGLCIGMGNISTTGQSVICLPHRVVVEITAEDQPDEEALDGITG